MQIVGQPEKKLPDPSLKARDGSSPTKPRCSGEFAFVEAARLLGGHPASRAEAKPNH